MWTLRMKTAAFFEIFGINLLIVLTPGMTSKTGVVHISRDYKCGDLVTLYPNIATWYDYSLDMTNIRDKLASDCATDIASYSSKFVAMVHSLTTNLNKDIVYAGNTIFGYNEPNHKTQSNITARIAAESWGNITQKFPEKKFASPSASPCGGGESNCISDELTWFDEFFSVCELYNCQVDYIATHAYMCDADKVMTYLRNLHERYNRDIFLTEFSCGQISSPLLMKIFMQQILPKLDAEAFIKGHNWYKARLVNSENGTTYVYPATSLLHSESSSATELGQIYLGYKGGPLTVEVIPKPSLQASDPSLIINEAAAGKEDLTGADKVEALAILIKFTRNPTDWPVVIYSIKEKYNQLPELVAAYYMTASKKDIKKRIREVFEVLMCTSPDHILDTELREEVKRVQPLPYDVTGLEKKGRLKIPVCLDNLV